MAKPSWITLNKESGSGNDTVNATVGAYTGRTARSGVITYKAANCQDVACTVNQSGKTEFVNIQSAASVNKNGALTLTLTGTSNSSKLTFSLGSNPSLALTLPTSYTAGGVSTDNGVAITGDPGASQQYEFSITFENIPENTTIDELVAQVIVEANGGQTSTCTVTQAAGDPYLNVSPATVTLAADGSETGTFTVSSNTSWTVE